MIIPTRNDIRGNICMYIYDDDIGSFLNFTTICPGSYGVDVSILPERIYQILFFYTSFNVGGYIF